MNLKASLMFAKSLIFPKAEKKSSARKSLFGALLCIGLSIVPLVVVLSITEGMIKGMTQRIIGLSSSHLEAYIAQRCPFINNYESFSMYAKEFLQEIPELQTVYPEIEISALGAGKTYRTGIQVRAVEKDIFKRNESFNSLFEIIEGDISDFDYEDSQIQRLAVIGHKMAKDLNLHPGDNFRIITTKMVNGSLSPKLTSFKVCAIVSSGYQELDQLWVFVPIDAAYKYLSLSNATYKLMLETKDAFSPSLVRIQRQVQDFTGRYANIYRWDQIHAAEFENFSSTKVMLVFVMMLIVLVASVNVSSAIVMLVMERKKEIAILKSIGAKPKDISFAFLLTGMTCGFGGVLLGLPVGIIISLFSNQLVRILEKLVNLIAGIVYFFSGTPVSEISTIHIMDPAYYLQNIPIEIPVLQIILISIGTIILSLMVSVIPSIKAGKEKPLDILRKN